MIWKLLERVLLYGMHKAKRILCEYIAETLRFWREIILFFDK